MKLYNVASHFYYFNDTNCILCVLKYSSVSSNVVFIFFYLAGPNLVENNIDWRLHYTKGGVKREGNNIILGVIFNWRER